MVHLVVNFSLQLMMNLMEHLIVYLMVVMMVDLIVDLMVYLVVNFSLQLTTFQISAPGGKPMQISVYRSQNGVRWG